MGLGLADTIPSPRPARAPVRRSSGGSGRLDDALIWCDFTIFLAFGFAPPEAAAQDLDLILTWSQAQVERTSLDAADRKAAIFEFEVDASTFTPGLYTSQVNVIDSIASQFSFSRFDLYVRAK